MFETKHTRRVWPVDAPFKIAYCDQLSKVVDLRPYVDFTKKTRIWGIAVGNHVFKLKHEPMAGWHDSWLASTKIPFGSIPTTWQLENAYNNRQGFNEIVALLNKNGVAADPWLDAWYWCNEEVPETNENAVVWDMECGKAETAPKRMKNGLVRYVTLNSRETNISIGYPVVYLHDGHFEISYNLYLHRLSEVWGIQLGKVYFRLTEESQKVTWEEGNKLCKSLTTKQIKVFLPKKEMFEEPVKYEDAVNDALVRLSAYGLSVDLWSGSCFDYLTSSEYEKDYFVSYMNEAIHKEDLSPCRLAGKNVKGTVVV